MTQTDNKLDVPHWSKLDNGEKFLYIFTSMCFLTILISMIIYYNILPMTLYSIGFSILIAGIIIIPIVDRLEK